MTVIRPATAADAPAIAAIWNQIIRDTLVTFTTDEVTDAAIADRIANAPVLIAEDAGTCVGFATFGPFRSGPGYRFTAEHTIHLAPAARGRGLGRALLSELEDTARQNGLRHLIGAVSGANPEAAQFHTALGYSLVATLPEVGYKSGEWLDVLLFQKRL